MGQLGCRNMTTYLERLKHDLYAHRQCELLMNVSISRFFRDCEFWRSLKENLLIDLVKQSNEKIKVWSAGCACGEEVYSFKMIWEGLQKKQFDLPELELLATDMNPEYLDRAKKAIYTPSSLKELPNGLKWLYFNKIPRKNLYAVKTFLKKGIVWKTYNLHSDLPESCYDIIFLRNNVLTYYKANLKEKAFTKLLESLNQSGLLVIGAHEKLPFATKGLVDVGPYSFVFRKI